MKLIVKPFAEITIKSRPVRKQFIRQLAKNIRTVLRDLDPELEVQGEWDNLDLISRVSERKVQLEMFERLRCTPGIAHFLEVHEYPYVDFDDTFEGGPVHAGAVIVPAVLAACERHRPEGRAVLLGIAVGTETMCRLSTVVPKAVHKAGFHPTAVFGVMPLFSNTPFIRFRPSPTSIGAVGKLRNTNL